MSMSDARCGALTSVNMSSARIICADQARAIDAAIYRARQQGFSKIEYDLPTNFEFPGMTLKDAQIIVYSDIIRAYQDKGYADDKIAIEVSGSRNILHIGWASALPDADRVERQKLIASHLWRGEFGKKK